jgi:hypothetical protein
MAPSTLAVMKAVNRGEHRPRPVITPGRLAKKGVRRHPKPPVNGMRGEPGDGVTLQDEAERPASLQGLGPDRLRREEAGPAYETGGDDGATGLEDVTPGDGGGKRGTVHERLLRGHHRGRDRR